MKKLDLIRGIVDIAETELELEIPTETTGHVLTMADKFLEEVLALSNKFLEESELAEATELREQIKSLSGQISVALELS